MAWDPNVKETRRMLLSFFASLFVFSVFERCLPSTSAATLSSDVTALLELRQGWDRTPGLAENWTLGTDPCGNQWIGVSCFQESVVSLLDGYGIVGTLSPSIGNLKNLLYLNLGCNFGLTGSIPEEIGNLSRLTALDLSNCSFSGTIPASLGNLKNASYIYLKRNQLTGEIPYTLGYLSKAFELALGKNCLTGNLPVSSPNGFSVGLNNLTSLLILDVKNNNLSGEIPPSLGQLQKLTTLLLQENQFYGCLSCAMSNGRNYGLDNLTEIGLVDLSANSFKGPVPDFLLRLPLINKLNLSFNAFTGVLNGNVRASGHVNVFLLENNISAVANLPNPFIDPKLGGNPVCQNQSFPFTDICEYSGTTLKTDSWQQQTSCAFICDQNSVAHPATCKCCYPCVLNMFFGWSPTYGLEGARIGHLRRELVLELNVPLEDLWIDHATYENSSELKVFAKVLLYPATSTLQWNSSQITYIESQILNETIRLVGYDPYGIISANLLTNSSNSGSSAAAKQSSLLTGPIIGGAIGGFVAMVTLSSLLVCFIKDKRRRPVPPIDHASEIFDLNPEDYPSCLFPYDELKSSTRNFSRGSKIGEGAYGAVYKGILRDGSEVAVKELPSNLKQSNQEFLNEVQLISSLEHKNLVKLRGCAISGNNRLLVYEYVENKCLAQALFDPGTAILLEWPFRYNIALGLAKGLAFLHSRGPQRLAHGDIKANNVLLDRNLEPKLADFGLARMCQNNERKVLTRIEGKRGYVAPEFALHGQLTSKADVFSFGIIALELVSGRESMNSKLPAEEQYLLAWAWTLYEQRRVIQLVDPKVREGCDEEQSLLLIKVALLCAQGEASSRPPMARVVAFLSGNANVPNEIPERPAFLGLGVTDPDKPAVRPTSITTW